ncbi:tetratricopeptide repeat protein [Candidatus Parcubacteria bacterium]|nr:tetratricopeptide repeat protein [Candidatus Parcubacteria bacterium]
MVELIFFAAAVALVYRTLRSLTPKGAAESPAARPVTGTHRAAPVKASSPATGATRPAPTKTGQGRLSLDEYARRLYADKKYLAAEKALLELIKLDPKNADAYTRLGMVYAALQNYSDSIECFRMVTRLQPTPAGFSSLGSVYYQVKNYPKAAAAYERALALEPAAIRYLTLARTYQKMNNNPKFIAALEQATAMEPNERALLLLAKTYLTSRNKPKALEAYERVLELNPRQQTARQAVEQLTVQS